MTILTSFRNPRDRQALVTSIYWRLPFLLKLEAFSHSDFAASNWAARASNILCGGVVTSAFNSELWGSSLSAIREDSRRERRKRGLKD
jgi:hypothetical protein